MKTRSVIRLRKGIIKANAGRVTSPALRNAIPGAASQA